MTKLYWTYVHWTGW